MKATNPLEFAYGRDVALYALLERLKADKAEVKQRMERVNPDDEICTDSYWQGQEVLLNLAEMKLQALGKEIEACERENGNRRH